MDSRINNLLSRIHPLASRQGENFVTESFVHLLLYLIEFEPDISLKFFEKLSEKKLPLDLKKLKSLNISTQVSTELGKPDIELRTSDSLVYIEVKIDSGFGIDQINRYRELLGNSGVKNSLLITITRHPVSLVSIDTSPDILFRWHHIADWLDNFSYTSEISYFLVDQFVNFLKYKGYAMENIGWELTPGIYSFKNCIDMIGEALTSIKIPINRSSAAWDWYGYYIEGKNFFIGIYFDTPNCITINSEVTINQIDPNTVTVGEIENDAWRNVLNLSSEEVHFFARSKASQIQCLEDFISESLDYARPLVK